MGGHRRCLFDRRPPRGQHGAGGAGLAGRPSRGQLVILGARTLEQLKENLGTAGLHLTADERTTLDAASDPAPADYPYGTAGTEQRTRRCTRNTRDPGPSPRR